VRQPDRNCAASAANAANVTGASEAILEARTNARLAW